MSQASATQSSPSLPDMSAILLEQADRLFQTHATPQTLAAADQGEWPEAAWRAAEEAGLTLALVPEELGGVGLPPAVACLLIRRAGTYAFPAPLAETMLATALWAEASGEVAEGTLTLAPDLEGGVKLTKEGNRSRLAGQVRGVPWAGEAGAVLVHARDERDAAYVALVPRASYEPQRRRNLAGEPRDAVTLDGILLPEGAVFPTQAGCRTGFMEYGAALRAQQMVGAMERCLDYALTYAQERKQFGRPIGKFQAVQHMLADAAGHHAAATAAADIAAEAWGGPGFAFAAAVAKARTGEAAGRVAEICHQVHGAMGFTHEHQLHFSTRRLWSWRDEFGNESYWQDRIGRAVCRAGGEAMWDTLVTARDTRPEPQA
jgi:acyl-CoA dehydrogenase